MKVAILTIPLNHNYGGNLQNFALQMTLKNMGHDPVTINYKKGIRRSYARKILSKLKRSLFVFKDMSNYPITDDEILIIEKNHRDFIEKYISISNDFYSEDEIKKFFDKENFDAVIVGSDQVWRPQYTPKIDPFFFSFLRGNSNVIKMSYAASFGTDIWEYTPEQLKLCRELVKEFDFISVRESLGVDMCHQYFDVYSEHVLDPTLLLKKDDYIDLFKKAALPDNSGKIFNYILDSSGDKDDFLKKISGCLGKEVFSTYPRKTVKDTLNITDIKEFQYPHIEAWLKSFHDADFVVTDSFHGTAFSIIFNKPFIAISNKARGAARFSSLLRMFDLESRLVNDFSEVDSEVLNTPIDFNKVNKILEESKKKSINALRKALEVKSKL
ncbi:polysaccharide pyruvyl transferase family protein [Serratia proteamaculans]|uniref:polysaccharide pyruvyl transferase family protein n=1 Tax=Serratia proteamaculans TaxID=28151 RepID=UPI0021782E78|nr:polysaccharide pyruvyl transferase family protein [Serratia proteamaculans]CAI0795727.1 Polysaccharide pyruvyl transferase [Serratia proteamaculans]